MLDAVFRWRKPPILTSAACRHELLWLVLSLLLSGMLASCSSVSTSTGRGASRGGGYYQQDGPGESQRLSDADLSDAVPRIEPLMSGPNKPYTVLGRSYTPDTRERPFRQTGIASWYGKQFHGRQTSSGEAYDMYAMTAAHPTLPIPSYARVTNLSSGTSVIVRVNDRGPFLHNRVIDLSYAAAHKLGYVNRGSTQVTVERILPEDIRSGRWQRGSAVAASSPVPTPAADPAASAARAGALSVFPPRTSVADAVATADPIAAFATAPAAPEPSAMRQDAAPAPDAVAASLPRVSAPGVYLQLGAFRAADGAESYARHLSSQVAELTDRLVIDDSAGWYRLQAGPYASRGEADVAADHLRQTLGASPLRVERP